MRNLKRVLSLVLALMMTFSLMVFTTSASAAQATIPLASEMYSDYDNVKDGYKEAIDVMTAIEVVDGTGEGDAKKLNPTEELTRAEATAILARLLLTPAQAANFNGVSATTQFTDVQYDHWAASYIAYCANQGIVSGHSPTEFDPNGQLTGVAFGKMLLVALGYNAENEGYTGNNWTTNVAVGLINAGIIVDDLDLTAPLTREAAMEMAFQALQAPLVEYAGSITVGGTTVNFGSGKANYVTSTLAREQRINNRTLTNTGVNATGGYTVEFAEKYFPSLWLYGSKTNDSGASEYRTDAFGRPAHTWTYKNVDINDPYLDEELFVEEWTGGVSGADLSKVINYSQISNYNLEIFVDGATVDAGNADEENSIRYQLKNNSKDALYFGNKNSALTGNGVLTQVFVDHEPIYDSNVGSNPTGSNRLTGNISIVIINTYLAQVTSTSKVNVYYGAEKDANANEKNIFASKDAAVSDYTKGDKVKVLVADPTHQAYDADKAIKDTRYKVQEVSDAKVVSDVNITSYSLNDIDDVLDVKASYLKTIVAGGETYNASKKAFYDANVLYNYNQDRDELKSATFAIYLDDYGFALGVEEMEAANNYIFVVGWAHGEDALGYKGDRALIITTDGIMKGVSADAENLKVWNPTANNGNGAWVAESTREEKSLTYQKQTNAAVNTWYTYSMDGDTYVLEREVRNQGTMAVADRNTGDKKADISNSYTSLEKNNPADTNGGAYAYGNDSSRYIVVTAENRVNDGGSITKVDRVVTGIANANINVPKITHSTLSRFPVSIKPWTLTNVENYDTSGASDFNNEIVLDTYFLYDNNNYVTYAVVIGDVVANSEDMLYFTGGVTQRSIDGQIYDRYNVIRNGELTTVDVLESVANDKNPQEGELFIAGFDSDGRVIALEPKSEQTISNDAKADESYQIKTSSYSGAPAERNETERYVLVKDPAMKLNIREDGNRTLWVARGSNDVGYIRLATKCAVFLNNKTTTLEKALEDTTKDGTAGFLGAGQVVAICNEKGEATALILTDKSTTPAPAPGNVSVAAGTHAEVRLEGDNTWKKSLTAKEGTTVYVRATDGYLLNVAGIEAALGVTLKYESDGVYSFTVKGNVNTSDIKTEVDESQKMTVTINVMLIDSTNGTSTVPSYEVYRFVKADFVDNSYTILAPDIDGFVPKEYNKTITWDPEGTVVTFQYTKKAQGDQSTTPGTTPGHPDSEFGDAYTSAELTIKESTVNGVKTITVTGTEDKLQDYLDNESNTTMNHVVNEVNYAFVGLYFTSPTDSTGSYADSVVVKKNGSALDVGMDENHRVFQWISVAKQNDDKSWTANQNRTVTYEITWTMSDKTTITDHCQVIINISPAPTE